MNIGAMRHRITFMQKVPTTDSEGFTQETWQPFKTVWAAVEQVSGREYYQAATVNAENDVRFRIRYLRGITQDMKISYNNKLYDIQSIIDAKGTKEELVIVAREVVQGAG